MLITTLPPSTANSRQPSRQQSVRHLSPISLGPLGRQPQNFNLMTTREELLMEGDVIGAGDELNGELIEMVYIPTSAPRTKQPPPADHLQVVRKLGTGNYAVVYLVKEILSTTRIELSSLTGETEDFLDEGDGSLRLYRYQFGREFAVKCLSKASLSPEELEIQMFGAKLHQSLPTHPNIVTLHRTLQTPEYLMLVLEYVPGEDLFCFLEQLKDYPSRCQESNSIPLPGVSLRSPETNSRSEDETERTAPSSHLATNAPMSLQLPVTPSSLLTLSPHLILSPERLRLIASMFSQMCDAVDACHKHGVSHRDIKPENFIIAEGVGNCGERRTVVKLSNLGLATLQRESSDMDVGSAAYMSYECRNDVTPTYAAQPSDVWSLGIVLVNLLYHHNPWSDTATLAIRQNQYNHLDGELTNHFVCSAFKDFVASPVKFFMRRFPGMTFPVAEFFVRHVFCMGDVSRRLSASEFGEWVRVELLSLMRQDVAPLREAADTAEQCTPQALQATVPMTLQPLAAGLVVNRDAVGKEAALRLLPPMPVIAPPVPPFPFNVGLDESIARLASPPQPSRETLAKVRYGAATVIQSARAIGQKSRIKRLQLGDSAPRAASAVPDVLYPSIIPWDEDIQSGPTSLPVPPLYEIGPFDRLDRLDGHREPWSLSSLPPNSPPSRTPKATSDSPRLHPGDFNFGLFKLVSRGGYCDVYQSSHAKWGSVALKRLRCQGEVDIPRERELYKREAELWKPLWHVNILRFYGWLEINREIFLVSPWMDNGTLRNFLKEHPESNRPHFIRGTADGLRYLHNEGVVHGDLKTSNILVSPLLDALLCDFGLSKVEDACSKSSSQCVGSWRWMSPETLDGKPRCFSSDIYAFGMTIYEILFGLIPFETDSDCKSDITVIKKVLSGARPSPPKNDIPGNIGFLTYNTLWDLANHCWYADRNIRPSIEAVVERLHTIAPHNSREHSSSQSYYKMVSKVRTDGLVNDTPRSSLQIDDEISDYWTACDRSETKSFSFVTAKSEVYYYENFDTRSVVSSVKFG